MPLVANAVALWLDSCHVIRIASSESSRQSLATLKMVKDSEIVGQALASVLPDHGGKPWYRTPHVLKLNLILLIPLLSSAVAGYDGSMMNGLQATSSWQNYFGNPKGSVLGVVNAAQSIGSVISLPLVGYLSDKIGRRMTLLSGCITVIVASAIQAGSVD